MIPMSMIDIQFAKSQLVLLLREWYMHPNGQVCYLYFVNHTVTARSITSDTIQYFYNFELFVINISSILIFLDTFLFNLLFCRFHAPMFLSQFSQLLIVDGFICEGVKETNTVSEIFNDNFFKRVFSVFIYRFQRMNFHSMTSIRRYMRTQFSKCSKLPG
jgi:hypothetical protein